MEIDFVVTWVDSEDLEWLNNKKKYQNSTSNNNLNGDSRYRNLDTFKYWFRSIEKYAPWVNKIYLITVGHYPKWLDIEHEKLVLVRHDEFIPKEYLPTFNSNVIELNLHRIENLTEKFVLFNDDVFLNSSVEPEDFFKEDLPRELAVYSLVSPVDEFSMIMLNNVRIINKYFNKYKNIKKNFFNIFNFLYGINNFRTIYTLITKSYTGYYEQHITSSMLKSTYIKLWDLEYELLDKTSKHKFREMTDVNQWLLKYWNIETGNFIPRKSSFGVAYSIDKTDKISKTFNKKRKKVICLNDVDIEEVKLTDIIKENVFLLEKKFPEKSSFENMKRCKNEEN
ncbi:Stealth CR1 domain-containing protein [Vagococcus sp.]|uniref:Stealth CR1 domain-containing protein n=1 Tax=Vagococcus sp. TaxID=1933889 RepID=UPI003F9D83F2